MTNIKKKLWISMGLGIFMYIIMLIIESYASRVGLNMIYGSYIIPIGERIWERVKYLLIALVVAIIPFEKIIDRMLFENLDLYFEKRTKKKEAYIIAIAGLIIVGLIVSFGRIFTIRNQVNSERNILSVFTTIIQIILIISTLHRCTHRLKKSLCGVFFAITASVSHFLLAEEFTAAVIVGTSLLLFSCIYIRMNWKINWYGVLISIALFSLFIAFSIKTFRFEEVQYFFDGNNLVGNTGVFKFDTTDTEAVTKALRHPFTLINQGLGTGFLILFFLLFASMAFFCIKSVITLKSISIKRAGVILGIGILFCTLFVYTILADIGVFPICSEKLFRPSSEIFYLVLLVRATIFVPVPKREEEIEFEHEMKIEKMLLYRAQCNEENIFAILSYLALLEQRLNLEPISEENVKSIKDKVKDYPITVEELFQIYNRNTKEYREKCDANFKEKG